MKIESAKFFQKVLDYAGEDCRIFYDYSGRGMFGKTTTGIVYDSERILLESLLTFLRENDIDKDEIPDETFRFDNMANQMIIY